MSVQLKALVGFSVLVLAIEGCSLINAPDEVPGVGGSGGGGGGWGTGGSSTSSGGGMAVCGNGKVEPGETCDPPAECPTSCDDGDPCTDDKLDGAPAACTAVCPHKPVTTCSMTADACCPASCDASTDADCAGCGDGMIGPGETCDGDCPATCDDMIACTIDAQQGTPEKCNVKCTHENIKECSSGDGCCPPGCAVNVDTDCCANLGGGSLVAENGTGMGVYYCYEAGDSIQTRALKACESHFGAGQCCVITGGYADMQYGQCNMGGDGTTIHWHWDNHPGGNHCAPIYTVGDVISPGWCGTVLGKFTD